MLYLLHGLSDDDTIWLRRTSIERYVAPLGLAVVMPQVHRSFYTDEAYGGRYWTFLSEELPAWSRRFFRVSGGREDTFVAGLSMGGYGALKLGAAAAGAVRRRGQPVRRASTWPGCDRAGARRRPAAVRPSLRRGRRRRPEDDLFALLGRPTRRACRRCTCAAGPRTRCYPDNRAFATACAGAGVPLTTVRRPASTTGHTGTPRSGRCWPSSRGLGKRRPEVAA